MALRQAPSEAPSVPSYAAAASVLERDKGSGVRLLGWTALRTIMIAPAMQLVGTPAKQAWLGAGIASSLMSIFVLLRIFDAKTTGVGTGLRGQSCRTGRPRKVLRSPSRP